MDVRREAEEELSRMECLDGAEKWALEIGREREVIARMRAESSDAEDQASNVESLPDEGTDQRERRETAEKMNNTDVAA